MSEKRNQRRKILLLALVTLSLLVIAGLFLLPWLFEYYTDGFSIRQSSRQALIRDMLWEAPKPFDGKINESLENYEPTFSVDGMTMIFTRGKAKHNADLFEVHRIAGTWSEPKPLTNVNSSHDELGPALTCNGRFLYFYSNRPGGIGGYDLWVSRFDGKNWSTPENLGDRVNSEFNEYGPGLSPSGDRIYFSSNRLERELTEEEKNAWKATLRENFLAGDYDIFHAKTHPVDVPDLPAPMPEFEEAQRLQILNSLADEGQVALTPRGDFLYFSSNRSGGLGRFDLYRSRILHQELLEPENLGNPVNSALDDMDPSLILEGHGLVFSSNRVEREGKRPFLIYKTICREVISLSDYSSLLTWLDKIKWPLLLLLLLLAALLFLLHYLMKQGMGLKASLLHRCLLLSLLIHLLLALLTSTWIVTYSLYDLSGEDHDLFTLNTDAMAEERLGLEIREQVANLASAEDVPLVNKAVETLPIEKERLEQAPLDFAPPEQPVLAIELAAAESMHRQAELPERPQHERELDTLAMRNDQHELEEPLDVRQVQGPVIEDLEDQAQRDQPVEYTPGMTSDLHASSPTLPGPERSRTTGIQAAAILNPREELLPEIAQEKMTLPRQTIQNEMETPQPRPVQENRLAAIVHPFDVERVEDRHLLDQASPPAAAQAPLLLGENLQRFDDSALANAKMSSVPVKSDERLSASRPQSRSFDLPEVPRRIAMEIPTARKAAARESKLAFQAQPKPVKRSEISETPRPESSDPVMASTLAFKDSALTGTDSIPLRAGENLPEVAHAPKSRVVPLTVRTEMELHKPSKPQKSQAMEPVVRPSSVVKREKIPSVTVPLIPPPRDIDLEQPAEMPRSSAMRKLEQVLPRDVTSPITPPPRKDLPLPLNQEIPSAQMVENTPHPSQRKKEPSKELDALADPAPSAPIPLAFMPNHPKVDFKPPVMHEPDPSPQSLLDLPPRKERVDSKNLAQYDHQSPPTYHGLTMRSKRVVFCLDISGSMEWNRRIDEAREELLRLLDALDERVEFNIITFSGRVRIWSRDGVMPGSEKNLASAKRFVRRARIGSDGTNTLGALAAALADEAVESIYFLSDGHPTVGQTTDSEQILRQVQRFKQGRSVTIHTIAYIKGDPPPEWRRTVPHKSRLIDLMRRLAEQNSGNFVVFDEP